MRYKALWYQNYKQTRIILWMILALFIIHLPFQAVFSLESWKERVEQSPQADQYVYEIQAWDVLQIFSFGVLPLLITVAVITLACLLTGLERNTRRNDFTFSLPFSRRDIFLAKWLYGVSGIFVFHILNFTVAYLIIYQSEFSTALYLVSWTEIIWNPLLSFILLFTFAMFIGTFSGEMISQIVLTFILGLLPIGIFSLIQSFTEVHFNFYLSMPDLVEFATIFNYIIDQSLTWESIVLPVVFIILFLWVSILLYTRNKIEHNGEFLIFKKLNPVFFTGIIVCFSLLGGTIVSSLVPWGTETEALRIIAYWIGFVTFLLFSLLITKRLISMNVTFKGKA